MLSAARPLRLARWLFALLSAFAPAAVRPEVIGPPLGALGDVQRLMASSGAGPGQRDVLFNGVPLQVSIYYSDRRPLAALQRVASGLRARQGELRAYSTGDGRVHALLRMPEAGGPIGLTLAWRERGDRTTLWDLTISGREALLALFAGSIDQARIPQPPHMEPVPGAELAFDMVDRGAGWLSHTRVFTSTAGVRSRVDYYTQRLQELGFELSKDAGYRRGSWLRSFRGPEGTLNLFVSERAGDSRPTDVLQFHALR